MKCPLVSAGIIAGSEDLIEHPYECLKGDCAWWDTRTEQCAITTITMCLTDLYRIEEAINRVTKVYY